MAYAIIETSGTQLRVEPGRFYDVNRLAADEDDTITFDRVLLVRDEDDVAIGQPLLEGATVEAKVLRHLRGRKIVVYKMQPKKKTRRKKGHRQELTRFSVEAIRYNGKTFDLSSVDAGSAFDSSPAIAPEETAPEETASASVEPEDTAGEEATTGEEE